MIKIDKIGDNHSEVLLLNKMALKIRNKCKWNDKPALIWQELRMREAESVWLNRISVHTRC
jgi:hypothetical protein